MSLGSGKNHKFAKSKESAFVTPTCFALKDFSDEFLSSVKISEDFTDEGKRKKSKHNIH